MSRRGCGRLAGWLVWGWAALAHAGDAAVDVEQRSLAAQSGRSSATYSGERLTLNFHHGDVRMILHALADFSKQNIVVSDTVQGMLTLRLKDVPWDHALDVVLQAKGLLARPLGNVIWVASAAEIATREKLQLEVQAQQSELEPLHGRVFALNYQHAVDVGRMLSGLTVGSPTALAASLAGLGGTTSLSSLPSYSIQSSSALAGTGLSATRILSKRGSVTADARTNQLFVSDTAERLEQIAAFIARIDIPVRQVVIEARIVEADDRFSQSLGAKLGLAEKRIAANTDLASSGLNGFNAAAVTFNLISRSATQFLNVELSALQADGRGNIVSHPRLVTTDNVKAVIEQGTELPYQTSTSSGATAVAFRKANLKLEVVPKITPNGNVMMSVDVSKDSVGLKTEQGYAIDTKHVQTQVLVEDGGTVVIGGILQENARSDVTKVPLLGDIPLLGYLFRNDAKLRDKTELMIFLTPRVVREGVYPQ